MKSTMILIFLFMSFSSILFAQSHDDFEDGTTQGWRMGGSPNAVNIPVDTTWAGLPDGIGGASDNYMVLMPDGSGTTGKLIVLNNSQWTGDFTSFTNVSIHVNNLTSASNIDLRMAFKINGGIGGSADSWVSSTNAITLSNTPGWQTITFPVDSNSLTALGSNSRTAILSDVAESRILDASSAANWRGDVGTDTLAIDNISLGDSIVTSTVGSPIEQLPQAINLLQNYPNPFNPSTKIVLQVPLNFQNSSNTTLIVYNSSGQQIKTLFSGALKKGLNRFEWNGRNNAGINVASGIYIYRLKTANYNVSKRMVLMR